MVKTSDKFHDRILIIDKTTLIHIGASLKHLGKKCFAFSSLGKSNIPDILKICNRPAHHRAASPLMA